MASILVHEGSRGLLLPEKRDMLQPRTYSSFRANWPVERRGRHQSDKCRPFVLPRERNVAFLGIMHTYFLQLLGLHYPEWWICNTCLVSALIKSVWYGIRPMCSRFSNIFFMLLKIFIFELEFFFFQWERQ